MASYPSVDDVVNNTEKNETEHNEHAYQNAASEPEIHWRTYVALLAMVLINYVAVISLQAPPAVVSSLARTPEPRP